MTEILLLDSGPLTTVQDLGRFGSQSLGVPPSGAADSEALRTANLLAGNDPGEACLECTLRGPRLEFTGHAAFSLCGARASARLNDTPVPMWETLYASPGDILSVGPAEAGLRIYLAFSGGLDVPLVLGSRSTYLRASFGGWEGRALRAGDRIPLRPGPDPRTRPPFRVPEEERPEYPSDIVVRALASHELDRFLPESVERFFQEPFTVSPKSDRMGCRLEGTPLAHARGADVVSSGVLTGTVQVPGDGLPIVLLADRQTTGGYTRIAHVIRADLPKLGQARPGDRVRFSRVDPEEARRALEEQERILRSRIRPRSTEVRPRIPSGETTPEPTDTEAADTRVYGKSRRFRVVVNGLAYDVEITESRS